MMRRTEVVARLRSLGAREGGVLLVHTSWRAVRPVEGGPEGLIEALRETLGPEGTLVLPSTGSDDDTPYDPGGTPADPSLGIVPEIFRSLPGVQRSDHPLGCAAIGPLAPSIIGDPLPIPVYAEASPYARVHEHDGQVLLLGCGHESDTTLHLAEAMAGVPYGVPRHVTVLDEGHPVRIDYVENDHCCQRFTLADDWLREAGKQREGRVGSAHTRLARSRDIVYEAMRRLANDPLLFLHRPAEGCEDCDLARASIRL
jgi:aminoglycoside N3'-acetyltransferase